MLALGATTIAVCRMVMSRALRLAAIGIVVGLVAAGVVTRGLDHTTGLQGINRSGYSSLPNSIVTRRPSRIRRLADRDAQHDRDGHHVRTQAERRNQLNRRRGGASPLARYAEGSVGSSRPLVTERILQRRFGNLHQLIKRRI